MRHPDLAALPDAPVSLVTPSDVSKALGVDRRRAGELVASGALGRAFNAGGQLNRFLVDGSVMRSIVEEGRVPLEDLPTGILVKVGVAQLDTEPMDDQENLRKWRGFDSSLDEDQLRRAVTWWWLVKDPGAYMGQHLFVALHQIIVAVYEIHAFRHHPKVGNPRIGFITNPASTALREEWIGRRAATRHAARWDPTGNNASPAAK